VKLVSALAAGSAAIAVGSTLGMRAGDVLALQQDGRPCALVRIGAINSLLLAGRVAENGTAPQAGTDAPDAAGYSSDAMAFNLGQLAEVSYAVTGGMLQRTRTAYPGAVRVTENIAADIVSLRVQYGFDTRAGEPARLEVDTWSETMMDADRSGASGASGDRGDWQRMAGLRLAVVARSPFRQAAGAGGACATTVAGAANAPRWQATDAGSAISLAHVPDWQCYRYRVAEAVVPLRNVIWGLP